MEDFSRKADEIFDSLKAKGASKVIVISSDDGIDELIAALKEKFEDD